MSLEDENKSVLRFNILVESVNVISPHASSPLVLINGNLINSRSWHGKEPETCRVVDVVQKEAVYAGKTAMMDNAEFTVLVGYRPPGWISDIRANGRQRHNGWRLERIDETQDGTLLDGNGQPLGPGLPPVWLGWDVYHTADFNDYDFGEFIDET